MDWRDLEKHFSTAQLGRYRALCKCDLIDDQFRTVLWKEPTIGFRHLSRHSIIAVDVYRLSHAPSGYGVFNYMIDSARVVLMQLESGAAAQTANLAPDRLSTHRFYFPDGFLHTPSSASHQS